MNESTLKIIAIILFVATYGLLLAFPKFRAYIALGAAVIYVCLGIMPLDKIFSTINWNVLLMIAGTMGLVSLFIDSKMPAYLGDVIIAKSSNVKWAIFVLSIFAGLISAFVDNVATVIMIAPIAVTMAKKLKISPVPAVIAIAISSNLQGAATLVGDTTSILLGSHANMNFFDFFIFNGKIGLFFIVELAALCASLYLLFIFRNFKEPLNMEGVEKEKVTDYFPTILLVASIVFLILASFIPADRKPEITNGLICMSMFIIGFVRMLIKNRSKEEAIKTIKDIDFFTLLLLASLFLVVGSITEVGLIDDISNFLTGITDNVLVLYIIIVVASVVLSAFIDNIPYVATMLPVVAVMATTLGIEPYVLYFGMISGATLGGNLTPIGASANIAALGILRKEGHEVKAGQFMKISVPFTLIAVFVGCLLIWFIY